MGDMNKFGYDDGEMCPWCHQPRNRPYIRAHVQHGRPTQSFVEYDRPPVWRRGTWERMGPGTRTTRTLRLPKKKVKVVHQGGWPTTGRTYVYCAHPFHTPHEAPKPPTIPPRVHHEDLRRAKVLLKRDLQGKHRR